jgi:ribonuclease R
MKKQAPKKDHKESNIIFGTYEQHGTQEYVSVGSKKYAVSDIKPNVESALKHQNKVKALIKPAQGKKPESVVILKLLGPELTLKQRIERVLADAHIATDFHKIVFSEADLFGDDVSVEENKKRLNLTNIPLCTIDGETAKDFDDAVFAQESGKNIQVIVAIADVSHYVKVGSALDEEAFDRGTSIYYPGKCVPMLPEQLSNGLCSLKPHVARLALMVSFEVGPKGRISRPEIKEAIIKSHARLTYNQVQDFYDNDVIEKIPVEVQRSLLLLRQAAVVVRQARTRRGAIDFDVVESVIALDDQGEPLAINPQARLESHKIIEDLMVATNEIVATYFFKKNIPTVYRVHEPPSEEKLENFFTTAKAFGAIKAQAKKTAKDIIQPKDLQQIMAHYQKSQYKETLNQLMLRAMMQARYSEQNLMHFGLASPAYLHFTSPIRRYADLIVHRQLRYVLFEKKPRKQIPEDALAKIADSISQREALATDIERKIDRLYATTFMASRVGDSFDGTIVACTEFGFFVRIAEYHVEGLVHIANIASARVNFMPEKLSLVVSGSNQRYMVGDKVRVKLINVNIDRGHIDFELVRDAQEIKDDTEISDKRRRNTSSRLRSASRGRSKQRR